MSVTKHEYTRDGVTVVWRPDVCQHSGICALGLPAVFNPFVHPWINMDGAELEQIVEQVRQCPSGAISIKPSDSGE
ncbi:MAG: (4Fe-4S)-binding protein [Armatimonadetes bacterium]|nr:(4Fe-4S)-binding protein [Armatimonadota bacterium]